MLGAILFILMGCGVDKSDSLITVDVTVNYPKKELVLQDFMGNIFRWRRRMNLLSKARSRMSVKISWY